MKKKKKSEWRTVFFSTLCGHTVTFERRDEKYDYTYLLIYLLFLQRHFFATTLI